MDTPQGGKGKIIDMALSDVRVSAVVASFVLSLWVVYLKQNINLDGILYMRAANMIIEGDWQGAHGLYSWLLYPSLIALVSKISGLGLEGGAHFLNACFSGLLSYVFISLVQEVGGSRKTILAAALLIVFYPEINEYSYKVIRGSGYWPFYLLSLLYFIRFLKAPSWRYAVLWNVSMIAAALFRIEGVVFIALLPFVLFGQRDWSFSRKSKHFLMAHSVNLAILASFLVLQATSINSLASKTGRLQDPLLSLKALWEEITVGLAGKSDILATTLLNQYSENYATLIVLLIPVVIFLGKLIEVITPLLFCLLMFVPFMKFVDFKSEGAIVMLWAGVINVGILFTFLFPQFFLQGRYVVALALTLMVFLPFVLVFLYERWQMIPQKASRKAWIYYLLSLFLVVNSGEALVAIPGASTKKYIKDSGLWIKENIPVSANIYSNNIKILFYSGHIYALKQPVLVGREDVTADWLKQWQPGRYEYLALRVRQGKSPSQEEIVAAFGSQPLKVFENRRKDKVLVFEGR